MCIYIVTVYYTISYFRVFCYIIYINMTYLRTLYARSYGRLESSGLYDMQQWRGGQNHNPKPKHKVRFGSQAACAEGRRAVERQRGAQRPEGAGALLATFGWAWSRGP